MTNSQKRKQNTQKLVMGAIMTALVIILQTLGSVTNFFGPFATAVGLIPIVIGSALCGVWIGGWLGFMFGAVVLLTGGAALFWGFNPYGTVITVLVKGICAGLVAGTVYKVLAKFNQYVAVFAAALLCPITNTALFLLGSYIFFLPYAEEIAIKAEMPQSGMALFFAMAMANFVLEIVTNIILAPVILRVLKFAKK